MAFTNDEEGVVADEVEVEQVRGQLAALQRDHSRLADELAEVEERQKRVFVALDSVSEVIAALVSPRTTGTAESTSPSRPPAADALP